MSDFVKNDEGKLQWSLMPFEQLEDTVRVLMKGAEKYSRDNWKKCDDVNRYKDALMRHVTAYIKGEERDPDDNLPHLAHAICNCLFLQYFNKQFEKEAFMYAASHGLVDTEEVKENKDTAMFGMNGVLVDFGTNGVLVDAEAVKKNEEAYQGAVPDKNNEFCKVGTQVKVLPKGEENFHLGVVLWDKKGFYISTFRKDYRLDEIEWFEKLEEEKNEQKAVRCPSKEDD